MPLCIVEELDQLYSTFYRNYIFDKNISETVWKPLNRRHLEFKNLIWLLLTP